MNISASLFQQQTLPHLPATATPAARRSAGRSTPTGHWTCCKTWPTAQRYHEWLLVAAALSSCLMLVLSMEKCQTRLWSCLQGM